MDEQRKYTILMAAAILSFLESTTSSDGPAEKMKRGSYSEQYEILMRT